MAEFVEIEDYAFNPDNVAEIMFFPDAPAVDLRFVNDIWDNAKTLTGDAYNAFIDWWDDKANVYRSS